MRIRTAVAATALGALVALGGATVAHADVDDQPSVATFGEGSSDWQEPSFNDQGSFGSGSEGGSDTEQGPALGSGDDGGSFLQ